MVHWFSRRYYSKGNNTLGGCVVAVRLHSAQSELPISGMEEAAGGVFSVKSNNNKKNATNIFIPAKENKESY